MSFRTIGPVRAALTYYRISAAPSVASRLATALLVAPVDAPRCFPAPASNQGTHRHCREHLPDRDRVETHRVAYARFRERGVDAGTRALVVLLQERGIKCDQLPCLCLIQARTWRTVRREHDVPFSVEPAGGLPCDGYRARTRRGSGASRL